MSLTQDAWLLKRIIEIEIGIGIGIEIEKCGNTNLLNPDFDSDFDPGKGISETLRA